MAISLQPNYQFAYLSRGVAHYRKNNFDRAIDDYSAAIRLDPNDLFARKNRGFAYYRRHDFDLAIADFNEAVKMNPRDSYARSSRGMAYLALDQLNRAIADFDEALRLMPDNPHAYYARGQAKLRRVDIEGGNADMAQARRSGDIDAVCELWGEVSCPHRGLTRAPRKKVSNADGLPGLARQCDEDEVVAMIPSWLERLRRQFHRARRAGLDARQMRRGFRQHALDEESCGHEFRLQPVRVAARAVGELLRSPPRRSGTTCSRARRDRTGACSRSSRRRRCRAWSWRSA